VGTELLKQSATSLNFKKRDKQTGMVEPTGAHYPDISRQDISKQQKKREEKEDGREELWR